MAGKFVIIGAGRVGRALARSLAEEDYEFIGAASRAIDSARAACSFAGTGRAATDPTELTPEADLVFITTPDDAIGTVCAHLGRARALKSGAVVAHCSGALPSSVLADARSCRACVGSMHPLQTFATPQQAARLLPGSYCCIEGDPVAVEALKGVAEAIGATPLVIPTESKTLYHAAAVMACNYLVTLQDAALRLGEAAGLPRDDLAAALLPLVKGTVRNLEEVGVPAALTGPIERGDVETVRRHLDAIAERVPELLPLYKLLARHTVEVALAKGATNTHAADRLLRLL